jgi:hypothetical protein
MQLKPEPVKQALAPDDYYPQAFPNVPMSGNQNPRLTNSFMAFILSTLSPHVTVGPSTPGKRPQQATFYSGFFVPTKNTGGIMPVVFCYGGLCGAGENLAGSFAGVENPIQSATQLFSTMGGGYSLIKGVTA